MPAIVTVELGLVDCAEALGDATAHCLPDNVGYFLCLWQRKEHGECVALGNTDVSEACAVITAWFEARAKREQA